MEYEKYFNKLDSLKEKLLRAQTPEEENMVKSEITVISSEIEKLPAN